MNGPHRHSEAQALAQSAMGPSMLNYRELAEHLGIGLRTCKGWVSEGVLPAPDLRLRGIVRWRASTIEKWLSKQAGGKGKYK